MPTKYDAVKIRQYLQEQPALVPAEHDGSYELLSEIIKSYASISDYSNIDFLDLNLVYLSVIGTWKHGVDRKKETIMNSHLSDFEKNRLVGVLERIWDKTLKHGYSNREPQAQGVTLGMFGTGFYSFKGKTTDQSARDFIRMCVDIVDMTDEDVIYDRVEQVLKHDFHGMKAASASVVLHCLKPEVFPILNSNMGSDNIFEALGIKLRKKGEVSTYVANCRAIKKYRDKNLDMKNYRTFDLAARELDRFLVSEEKDAKIDIEKLKAEISAYKSEFPKLSAQETYKWRAVKCFQDNFNIDAPDFADMLARSLAKEENLLSRRNFFAKAAILEIAAYDPEYTRNMFRSLFDESEPVLNRIKQFEDDAEIYYNVHNDRSKKTHQDVKASSVYLFFRYPEKYYIYLSMKFEYCAIQLGYEKIPAGGSMERVQAYFEMADQIWEYAKQDEELVQMNQSRLDDSCYSDPWNHVLAEDIAFYINWRYKDAHSDNAIDEYSEYFPSLEEYNPGLTVDQYEKIFSDESIIHRGWLDTVYYLYQLGGEGTCKQIALNYGNSAGHYNANATTTAKHVQEVTGCPIYDRPEGGVAYWPILFVGKDISNSDGVFIWRLRKPVEEAIKSMEEKGLFTDIGIQAEYPKNMILYGPPGTGKTYHTVIYAVAIIEGKELEKVMAEEYAEVKKRYDCYAAKGLIEFITFHQSYGYEEFIEGIKPVMDFESVENDSAGNDVVYTVKPGVFKEFCEKASMPIATAASSADYGFNTSPNVWKVSLYSANKNPIRDECMKNNHIRIGWDSYGEQITDETDFSVYGGKSVLNAFLNRMKVGDVVFSCFSASTIDAIGVVTGEYEWHPEYDELKRVRNVKWLVKDLNYNIVEVNGGAIMTLASVYRMNVSMADVANILEETLTKTDSMKYVRNQDRHVFIIDEINRGNISKIFGELITLIEESKRIGQAEEIRLKLPYSNKSFGIPDNIYIIGTMNTADRSIALMDTALRRRFRFIEMQPDPEVLDDIDVEGINISELVRIMNKRIQILCDREHTIGHAFFMPLKETPTMECLADIFRNSIIPLLQEYFYDDYEKIRLVLADNQKNTEYQFVTKMPVDITDLFGNTEEDINADFSYVFNEDVFTKAEAYKGIY